MIVSPCISICKSDPITDFCYGCARNSEEKLQWKDKNTLDNWKLKNLTEIKSCLLYTSPSPRDSRVSRMPSSA